jgi:LacI family transcriptional regulator
MAFTDAHAWRIQRICHDIGLAIPEEVSLIGVNNDDLIVHICQPPLSSVELNAVKIGYEAAALLDGLMHGRRTPGQPMLVPPVGVVARGSSDIEAVGDPEVAGALRFIREHAADGIEVEDVLDRLTVSRRTLERRFRDYLGRSPHDEIVRVRLERAERLLAVTRATVASVAESSGFGSPKHFHRVFKQQTGLTPVVYRNRCQ